MKRIFFFVILACLFNPLFVKAPGIRSTCFFSLSGENKIFFRAYPGIKTSRSRPDPFQPRPNHLYYKSDDFFLSFVSFSSSTGAGSISARLLVLAGLSFLLAESGAQHAVLRLCRVPGVHHESLNINPDDIVPIRFTQKKVPVSDDDPPKSSFVVGLRVLQAISLRSYYDFRQIRTQERVRGHFPEDLSRQGR